MKDNRPELSMQYHAEANAQEAAGNPIMAGILPGNILDRPLDLKPIHKPNIGPYSEDNPCHCLNCGKDSLQSLHVDWGGEKNCDQNLNPGSNG